ncbi:DUF6114 domain-containing protein [Haloterrigena alkaliphila]|uniref:Uncharacterized protein n=1 Tax=Haloterrigena alkaliphila TaxID=2816475 RepID=A0A8A2VP25_9EURY|nr:DUF6114 domain-containing protein [Haloterrigena alkaliphila]QSW99868.1 DUF6114 domain-containing protein [Haloterrigena alkaliphila]
MATQHSQDGSETISDRLSSRLSRFNDWRTQRPFLGGVLLCLAGILITWVPMQILPDLIFIGGQVAGFLAIGALFGVLVFLTGIYALYKPTLSDEIGVIGVVLSIFSLFGSLGGLFVGMLLGILGGNLCLAWQPDAEAVDDTVTEPSKVDRAAARVRGSVLGVVGKSVARLRGETGRVQREGADE